MREAKRQNIAYRPFAIRGLGQVSAARTDIDMISTVFEIVTPLVDQLAKDSSDAMDVDEPSETKMTADLREKTLAYAIDASEKCLRPGLLGTAPGVTKLQGFLRLAADANSTLHARLVASTIFDAIKSLSGKLDGDVLALLGDEQIKVQAQLWALLSLEHFGSAPEAFRLKRAQAARSLADVAWKDDDLAVNIKTKVKEDFDAEKSPVVKQALRQGN